MLKRARAPVVVPLLEVGPWGAAPAASTAPVSRPRSAVVPYGPRPLLLPLLADAHLAAVDVHVPGLELLVGAVRRLLAAEADVHVVFARDAGVGRLAAVHDLAELRHDLHEPHAAVRLSDPRGDAHGPPPGHGRAGGGGRPPASGGTPPR